MFTGIIENTGKVRRATPLKGNVHVEIEKPKGWKLGKGQSVSVDGICSTVIATNANSFSVEYMPETLKKTTAGSFTKGSTHNFERSLTLGKLIDGHLLQGHVDARVRVSNINTRKGAYLLTISIPKSLLRFVAQHGSIAINGISLTVARLRGSRATVALIPYTLSHTNLGSLRKGDEVNLEVDLLARYLDRIQHVR